MKYCSMTLTRNWLAIRSAALFVASIVTVVLIPLGVFGADGDVAAEWKFGSDTAGWKAVADCTLTHKEAHLVVEATGSDPHFSNTLKAPTGWKRLRLRARFKGGLNGQVFWSEDGKPGFSEERSVTFATNGNDGSYRTIDVFFNPSAPVTGLRIDPDSKKNLIEFASIELLNQAPPAPKATPVEAIKVKEGFKVERLYSVPQAEGSWVSLCVDGRGRLITSDQYGKLYRLTPQSVGSSHPLKVEPIPVELGMAQGLLWAFDSLYVVVNGDGSGLYRVRDTNNDDVLDSVKLLRAFEGSSEHGPHSIILHPDRKSLVICAGNHTKIPNPERSRLPRNWDEDQLIPRMWDAGGHAVGIMAPGGWIARTDPEGKEFELLSAGFRNQYDIAFNLEGELFTYDADMEWDIGSPWYRPTRVNHAPSGAEFGWRSGTGKWPSYSPDSLGSVVDIGPGSPTGIAFGYGARFAPKYQQALFICDWSYGVMYAVHLKGQGASYVGEAERFLSAAPLPLTDVVVNPHDGAMYFTIGGRRTQSGLYRVTYVGGESTLQFPPEEPAEPHNSLIGLRRQLDTLHQPGQAEKLDFIWKHIGHADRNVRYSARIALEFIPAEKWQHKVASEKSAEGLINGSLAVARAGDKKLQSEVIAALGALDWKQLSETQQLSLLRAYGLLCIRCGTPSTDSKQVILKQVDSQFPAKSEPLNRELVRLLCYLEAPDITGRALALLTKSPTQEEQTHVAYCLRGVKSGWTLKQREEFFSWFLKAAGHRGGNSFGGFLKNIRQEAIDGLSDADRKALETLLAKAPDPATVSIVEPRAMVKKYSVQELLPQVQSATAARDFDRGKRMFAQGACFKCHRIAGEGGTVGPDLTSVGGRFNETAILESLIEPSKVVSDQFQATTFVLENGKSVTGRIVNLVGDNYLVSENMLDPGRLTAVNRHEVEEMLPSKLSMMPTGLLDTLTVDEILDLVAYIRAGGRADHEFFKPAAK